MALSKTEIGRIRHQVKNLFNESGINCIGQSKYLAKNEQVANGAKNSQEIHKGIGIYSIETAERYQKLWTQIYVHAIEKYKINNINELNSKHINSFLTSHSHNEKKTLKLFLSSVNKLESTLQMRYKDRDYDFQNVINKHRKVARTKQFNYKNRAYSDVPKLIEHIHNPMHKLVAEIQYITGARITEASRIKISQIDGKKLYYSSKGGKEVVKTIPTYIANQIEHYCKQNNGLFKVDQNSYRDSLEKASIATGQVYAGSHGIRWAYAKNMYDVKMNKLFSKKFVQAICEKIKLTIEYVKENIFKLKHKNLKNLKSNQVDKVLRSVSEALGHNRPSITKHYLGFGASC